jgi:hypothetical protein
MRLQPHSVTVLCEKGAVVDGFRPIDLDAFVLGDVETERSQDFFVDSLPRHVGDEICVDTALVAFRLSQQPGPRRERQRAPEREQMASSTGNGASP